MLEKYTYFMLKSLGLLPFNRWKSVTKFCYILKMNSQSEVAVSFNLSILRNVISVVTSAEKKCSMATFRFISY
jgi:hypothetical protein